MVDEQKYLRAIKGTLRSKGQGNIATLLDNAKCAIVRSPTFSHRRWDCYWTTIHFYVPIALLEKFDDNMKRILLSVADDVMPKDEAMDVMDVEISPDLESIPESEIEEVSATNKGLWVPSFGVPSNDEQYECDVFVIMPFDESFAPTYRDIIKPTVEKLGLSVKRGDEPFSDETIMFDVWSLLNACKLVVADCTGRNPNVFYELGIAHTIGRPVIMITRNIKELPFDVQHRRAIVYDTAFNKVDEFKTQLQGAIRNILRLDSHRKSIL